MVLELSFIFFFTFAALFTLRKFAKTIGLVDKPTLRKQHDGIVPLVGGLAVFLTVSQFLLNHPEILSHTELFLTCVATLILVGAIDDKYDISFKFRLVVQTLVTVAMMYFTGMELNALGNVLGFGELEFGPLAPFITILAVLGAINAFNMVDGIDGLLGGISIVSFTSIGIIMQLNGKTEIAFLCLVVVVAMLPYVMMNLGVLGKERRVFMGDAGSMMIGFMIIWLLLTMTQPSNTDTQSLMRPVTALWLIALPLMDMAAIVYRRIKRGRSPFKPDRDHLHHICQRAGLSKIQTLFVICGLSAGFAIIGIIGEYFKVAEWIMFSGFLTCFLMYSYSLLRNWPKKVSEMLEEPNQNAGEYVSIEKAKEKVSVEVVEEKKAG